MKSTAVFLAATAALLAALALWSSNRAQASDVVTLQILDDSQASLIVARLTCESSSVEELINRCGDALRKLCPDGGNLGDMEESAQGILPARIAFTVVCLHREPSV